MPPTDTDQEDIGPLLQLVQQIAGMRGDVQALATAHYNEVQLTSDVRIRLATLLKQLEDDRAAAQPLARLATVAEKTFDWLTATPDPSNPGRSRFQELVRNAGWFVLATGSGGTVVEIAHRMGWP